MVTIASCTRSLSPVMSVIVTPTATALPTPVGGGEGEIVFVSDRSGSCDIWKMSVDGTGVTQLTSSAGCNTAPVWSPDGSKIAFSSDRDGDVDIYVMNADGSGVIDISNSVDLDDEEAAWSPDGSRIAFRRGSCPNAVQFDVWIMNSDGSGQVNLTNYSPSPPLQTTDKNPYWKADGSKIYFASDRYYPGFTLSGDLGTELYSMNPDGSGIVVLLSHATDGYGQPVENHVTGELYYLTGIDLYGSVIHSTGVSWAYGLDTTGRDMSVSPDGTRVAYSRTSISPGFVDDGEIYIANNDGSGQFNLTNHAAFDQDPDWK